MLTFHNRYIILNTINNQLNRFIILKFKNMNIKIIIKDTDSTPLLHTNQLSQIQQKKKNALYQKPTKDKNTVIKKENTYNSNHRQTKKQKNTTNNNTRNNQTMNISKQAQRKLLQDFDKMSRNQTNIDAVNSNNNILHKNTEVMAQNNKALINLVKNKQQQNIQRNKQQNIQILEHVRRQVEQMKKIKQQIQKASNQFLKTVNQAGNQNRNSNQNNQNINNITQMNQKIKSIAEISKNQLQGIQNLQAINSLQNFNIQAYSQAVFNLKRQIAQYQKQSEQIQRQIKIRVSKLNKLDIPHNLDEQAIRPIKQGLRRKADQIDLYSIKNRIQEKIGVFDYVKFQSDINSIMAEVKGQISEFYMICQQHKIQVPAMKFDVKQIKSLDVKLPNAIEEYKKQRGIDFNKSKEEIIKSNTNNFIQSKQIDKNTLNKTSKEKGSKIPQSLRNLKLKTTDYAHQVKLKKQEELIPKTVLQDQQQRDKKKIKQNITKAKYKRDQDFDKYLQMRANDELQMLYKQKQQRLNKKKAQLYHNLIQQQPKHYLRLNLQNQFQVIEKPKKQKKQQNIKKELPKQQIIQKKQQFTQLKPIYRPQATTINSIGTQVLKQKLKSMFNKKNINQNNSIHEKQQVYNLNNTNMNNQMQNMASTFINLINNTLTQVNNQISHTINRKIEERSHSRQQKIPRTSPKKQIPKSQQKSFSNNPARNMSYNMINGLGMNSNVNRYPSPSTGLYNISTPKQEKKIEIKQQDYSHLKVDDNQEQYQDLNISESYEEDFEKQN